MRRTSAAYMRSVGLLVHHWAISVPLPGFQPGTRGSNIYCLSNGLLYVSISRHNKDIPLLLHWATMAKFRRPWTLEQEITLSRWYWYLMVKNHPCCPLHYQVVFLKIRFECQRSLVSRDGISPSFLLPWVVSWSWTNGKDVFLFTNYIVP